MPCPIIIDLPGLNAIKGCKNRPQRAGVKNNLQYQSCTPQSYNGPYEKCPWYPKEDIE